MWLSDDTDAALEWFDYEASLCTGCRHPRNESFDRSNDGRYDVERLVCHACAARDRRASNLDEDQRYGTFLIIKHDDG